VLALASNFATAALGLLAPAVYVLVYTPLKARTHWRCWSGPCQARCAADGVDRGDGEDPLPGLVLFGILFFWQLPHFIAIALVPQRRVPGRGVDELPLQKGDQIARRWQWCTCWAGGLQRRPLAPAFRTYLEEPAAEPACTAR